MARNKKRKRAPQTEASGAAGPPSKKSVPPPAPNALEVLRRAYTDCSQLTEGLSQSQQKSKSTEPNEHPQTSIDPKLLAKNGRDLSSSDNTSTETLRSRQKKLKAKNPKKVHPQQQPKETEPQADPKESPNPRLSRKDTSTPGPSATPSGSKELVPPTEIGAKMTTPVSSKGTPATALSKVPPKTRVYKQHPMKSLWKEARMSAGERHQILETVSPHNFVRSKANDIRDAPWLNKDGFAAVYTWLYSNKAELISKGVARVAAWSTRGKLPVGIDITAHLCEAFLMEMKYNVGNSYQAVSFGFSVAITR